MMGPAGKQPVVVVGGGLAGLATALALDPLPVTLLAAAPIGREASTPWAQGGIAAAIGADDAADLHAADTLAAGAGLCDRGVAARVAAAGARCIEELIRRGVRFDRDPAGRIALGLEAAHSRRRIVHARGDATGRAVLDALALALRASAVEILEGVAAGELALDDGRVVGVHAERAGKPLFLPARAVVLATGGLGGLFRHTTNPLGSTGSGVALAARAGAALRDLEFVQFHPTAIDVGLDPMPLASEALRGEGALLVNDLGERFLADAPGQELAPRDVVARAIWHQIERGRSVYLDARRALGQRVAERFPTVTGHCRAAGCDPATQPIPVRPAAHYHMGGVAVDSRGRSSLAGLWACGEVAATGLHGANRLASNSLLEGLAYARWIAEDIAACPAPVRPTAHALPVATTGAPGQGTAALRPRVSRALGVIRDGARLRAAIREFGALAFDPALAARARDAALVTALLAAAANRREESRGAHFRADYPQARVEWARSIELRLGELPELQEFTKAAYECC